MPNLDGTETLKPTPFDAHEQVVRGPHVFDKENGYVAVDAKKQNSEFPKAIDHVQMPDGHSEPIVAKNAVHEVELTAKEK